MTGLDIRQLIDEVEAALSNDYPDDDAWCLFRGKQQELGTLATDSVNGYQLKTISFLEFLKRLDGNTARSLGVKDAIDCLKVVDVGFRENEPVARRLTRIQGLVLDVRTYLERDFNGRTGGGRPLLTDVGRAEACRGVEP